MVFQDPMTSFNPVYRVGSQIVEAIRAHRDESARRRRSERAIELLDSVGIPERRARASTTTRTNSPAACASGR